MANDNPWGTSDPNQNPFLGSLQNANSQYLSQAPSLQQNMAQLQGQINTRQGQQPQGGSGYPAYTNSYGLGSTPPPPNNAQDPSVVSPGMASNPDYLKDALTASAQSVASRGFNPWSLTGESNARGK